DAVRKLFEEGQVDLAEPVKGGQLDHRQDLALEEDREDDEIVGWSFPEAGADLDIVARYLRELDALLLENTLAHQSFPEPELVRQGPTLVIGIAREEFQDRLAVGCLVDIEDAVLYGDERRQLGEDEAGDGQGVTLALEQAGETGDVGLEPVLLGVDPRRVP